MNDRFGTQWVGTGSRENEMEAGAKAPWSVTYRRPSGTPAFPVRAGSPNTAVEVARRETVRTPSDRASPSRPGGSIACPRA